MIAVHARLRYLSTERSFYAKAIVFLKGTRLEELAGWMNKKFDLQLDDPEQRAEKKKRIIWPIRRLAGATWRALLDNRGTNAEPIYFRHPLLELLYSLSPVIQ